MYRLQTLNSCNVKSCNLKSCNINHTYPTATTWTVERLGEIGWAFNGLTRSSKDNFGYGSRYITYKAIHNNRYVNAKNTELANINKKEKENKLKVGDALFTASSETIDTIGMTSIFECTSKNIYLNSFCFGYRIYKPKLTSYKYLAYLFDSSPFRKKLMTLGQGSTRYNLSKNDFLNIKIKLPTLAEQNKINEILTTCDKIIQQIKDLSNQTKLQQKYLINNLINGIKRFKEFKRQQGYRNTKIGSIPMDWKIKKLAEISTITIGLASSMTKHYRKTGVTLIRNSDIKPHEINKNNTVKLCPEFANYISNKKLKLNDITTVHTGEVGVSALITPELHGCFSFGTLNTRPNPSIIDSAFLCFYFNTQAFYNRCARIATGDGRNNLNVADFKKMLIPLPSLPEQQKIVKTLKTIAKEISQLKEKKEIYKQEKKYLMQQLLTGATRVRVD